MQVGEYKLSSFSNVTANRRPSSNMYAWKASMSLHGKQATYMKSKAIHSLCQQLSHHSLCSNFEMMPQKLGASALIHPSHIATVVVPTTLWIFRSPWPTIPYPLLVSPSLRSRGLFPSTSQLSTVCSVLLLCVWCFLRLRSRRDVAFRLASRDVTCYATGLVPDRR